MNIWISVCSAGSNKKTPNKASNRKECCWRWFHENLPANILMVASERLWVLPS